ncbi:MAG: deoxyribodipyrimidine photo-lyase [Patiriisocius sp.]|jgi:deoxyribodipyrimidine photo-lyase
MKLFDHQDSIFPTYLDKIVQRVRIIDPVKYGSTLNYINDSGTYLSPYISRGIISTRFVLSKILSKGFKPAQIEEFIQELAWANRNTGLSINRGLYAYR